MLYRRPANPKPPPHREPRRGGSVFHGAKSAPRRMAFWIAAGLCVLAGLSFLTIGRRTFERPATAERLAPAL